MNFISPPILIAALHCTRGFHLIVVAAGGNRQQPIVATFQGLMRAEAQSPISDLKSHMGSEILPKKEKSAESGVLSGKRNGRVNCNYFRASRLSTETSSSTDSQ